MPGEGIGSAGHLLAMRIIIEDAEGDIEAIRAAVVKAIIEKHGEELTLFSGSQLCGLLDLTPKAINEMKIPKVDLLENGRAIRYRLTDLTSLIEKRTIKAASRR